jgi:multisubunit Na+/H+ antiporter MnhB subunit
MVSRQIYQLFTSVLAAMLLTFIVLVVCGVLYSVLLLTVPFSLADFFLKHMSSLANLYAFMDVMIIIYVYFDKFRGERQHYER